MPGKEVLRKQMAGDWQWQHVNLGKLPNSPQPTHAHSHQRRFRRHRDSYRNSFATAFPISAFKIQSSKIRVIVDLYILSDIIEEET
jgi:hypothetical protein